MKKLLALLAVVLAASPAAMAGVTTDGAFLYQHAFSHSWGNGSEVIIDGYSRQYTFPSSTGSIPNIVCFTYNTTTFQDFGCDFTAADMMSFNPATGTAHFAGTIASSLGRGTYTLDVLITKSGDPVLTPPQPYTELGPNSRLRVYEQAGSTSPATASGTLSKDGVVVATFPGPNNNQAEISHELITGIEVTP